MDHRFLPGAAATPTLCRLVRPSSPPSTAEATRHAAVYAAQPVRRCTPRCIPPDPAESTAAGCLDRLPMISSCINAYIDAPTQITSATSSAVRSVRPGTAAPPEPRAAGAEPPGAVSARGSSQRPAADACDLAGVGAQRDHAAGSQHHQLVAVEHDVPILDAQLVGIDLAHRTAAIDHAPDRQLGKSSLPDRGGGLARKQLQQTRRGSARPLGQEGCSATPASPAPPAARSPPARPHPAVGTTRDPRQGMTVRPSDFKIIF